MGVTAYRLPGGAGLDAKSTAAQSLPRQKLWPLRPDRRTGPPHLRLAHRLSALDVFRGLHGRLRPSGVGDTDVLDRKFCHTRQRLFHRDSNGFRCGRTRHDVVGIDCRHAHDLRDPLGDNGSDADSRQAKPCRSNNQARVGYERVLQHAHRQQSNVSRWGHDTDSIELVFTTGEVRDLLVNCDIFEEAERMVNAIIASVELMRGVESA